MRRQIQGGVLLDNTVFVNNIFFPPLFLLWNFYFSTNLRIFLKSIIFPSFKLCFKYRIFAELYGVRCQKGGKMLVELYIRVLWTIYWQWAHCKSRYLLWVICVWSKKLFKFMLFHSIWIMNFILVIHTFLFFWNSKIRVFTPQIRDLPSFGGSGC